MDLIKLYLIVKDIRSGKIIFKLKIVTHHWSGNWMKGFDIYEKLDQC